MSVTKPERWPSWAAAAAGALWFLFGLSGRNVVNPTALDWAMRDDWEGHVLGWLMFRAGPWTFPLTKAPLLVAPYGSTVGFADGNPWVALVMKALSPLLPVDFQYLGLWLLFCFAALGWMGAALMGNFTKDPWMKALGGSIAALAPVVSARLAHPTLCAHFFLLAFAHLNLRRYRNVFQGRRAVLVAIALIIWSCGTHVYWSFFLCAGLLALLVRLVALDRLMRWFEALGWLVAGVAMVPATFYLFGFIGGQPMQLQSGGFGEFSADLLTLINPSGYSRFFGGLPMSGRQGEGYGYLGLGVWVLLSVRVVSLFVKRGQESHTRQVLRRALPWIGASVLLAIYAFSSKVTVAGKLVLDLQGIYSHLTFLTGVFRSGGRYIWALVVTLELLGLSVVGRFATRPLWGRALLAVVLLLQVVEFNGKVTRFGEVPPPMKRLSDPAWALMGQDYKHLVLHPHQLQWVCRFDVGQVATFSYQAYLEKMSINSGYVARVPIAATHCEERLNGPPDPDSVYVLSANQFLADFRPDTATCALLEGAVVCVSNARETAFRTALLPHALRPAGQ